MRNALLDELTERRRPSLRWLVQALVDPVVAKLDDPNGGRNYLQIVDEVLGRPVAFRSLLASATGSSTTRWSALVEPFLPQEAVGPPLHRRLASVRFVHGELASRARERRSDHHLAAGHLVDLVTAMLRAPISAQVRATLDQARTSTGQAVSVAKTRRASSR